MRRVRGLAALTLVAISAVVATCVYPTEHDADVFVTIDSLTLDTLSRTPTSVGPLVVIQGAEGDVHATAWHRQSGGAVRSSAQRQLPLVRRGHHAGAHRSHHRASGCHQSRH